MESYDEILERMKGKFAELSGTSINDDSDVGIRLKVLAGEVFSLQNNVEWLKNQMFAQTAVGEQLEYLALERGLARKSAVHSTGTLKFTRDVALNYDLAIPHGTVCATNGIDPVRVVTTEAAMLKAGETAVTVAARSEVGGAIQNTGAKTVKIMVTPPTGITAVINDDAFVGGMDAENDEELRERLMDSYQNISNGTNSAFYKSFVLKYGGVYSASVVAKERGVGTVDIYLAAKGGAPSDELIEQIQAELNNARELNVDVQVNKAQLTEVAVGVQITIKPGYDYNDVKARCETSVTEYFNTLKIGEPFLIAALGNAIYNVQGLENYYVMPSISIDRYMGPNQLAIKGSVQISRKE